MSNEQDDIPDALLDMGREFSQRIRNGRSLLDIMKAMDGEKGEVNELREEVEIRMGVRPGTPGKDGVVGEAIDLFLCSIDMIFEAAPDITNREIIAYAHEKLVKWEENYSDRISKDG